MLETASEGKGFIELTSQPDRNRQPGDKSDVFDVGRTHACWPAQWTTVDSTDLSRIPIIHSYDPVG